MTVFILLAALCLPALVQAQTDAMVQKQQQKKAVFESDQQLFVEKYISQQANIDAIKNRPHDGHDHGPMSEEQLLATAKYEARMRYVTENLDTYNDIYFPATAAMGGGSSDTLICDNGGFEDDFDFYEGYITTYRIGSDSCAPQINASGSVLFTPSSFVQVPLPVSNRFEIVTSGSDPLIGIDMVRFGSKSLKINSSNGHVNSCLGDYGVDKVVKDFIVTTENREFTVWYAVALENPPDHDNTQPFFTIKCDLAPSDDLCFDADILQCEDRYIDQACTFDSIDVLSWTCHRICIPASEIGKKASLEITMADCGQRGHFGYAYIDGICEDCMGSALGATTLYDQSFDAGVGIDYCNEGVLTMCGRISIPTLCNDTWVVDSIAIDGGISISNLTIDTVTGIYCFDLASEDFVNPSCKTFVTQTYFSSPTNTLPPVVSNEIEICYEDFPDPYLIVDVMECNDNSTATDISDDYYFVEIEVKGTLGTGWDLFRQLADPYPDESGRTDLDTGSGDQIIVLGPFLIQEGDWYLELDVFRCDKTYFITPPDFCAACDKFDELEISNVTCQDLNPDDKWSFDIFVPTSSFSTPFTLVGGGYNSPVLFGSATTITHTSWTVASGCQTLSLIYDVAGTSLDCTNSITVCPPKPCSVSSDCQNLEVTVREVVCQGKTDPYYVVLDVDNSNGGYLCYTDGSSTAPITSGQAVGPFPNGSDIELTVMVCDRPNCSDCSNTLPDCYKFITVADPDDCEKSVPLVRQPQADDLMLAGVTLQTNIITDNVLHFENSAAESKYQIIDLAGNIVQRGELPTGEVRIDANFPQGLYFIRYQGSANVLKVIKL